MSVNEIIWKKIMLLYIYIWYKTKRGVGGVESPLCIRDATQTKIITTVNILK